MPKLPYLARPGQLISAEVPGLAAALDRTLVPAVLLPVRTGKNLREKKEKRRTIIILETRPKWKRPSNVVSGGNRHRDIIPKAPISRDKHPSHPQGELFTAVQWLWHTCVCNEA